jgi:TupA-like ATPgrasp
MIYSIKNKVRNLSHENKLINQLYLFANRVKIVSLSFLSDGIFAKMKYRENTGRRLRLENPLTFNEKLWWLKINNRDPLLTICSDKYKVRDYVRECGLGHILNTMYGVYDKADEIDFNKLPEKAFIKTNHGSAINVLFDRNKPFDIKKFTKKFNGALKQNYYLQSREWNYKNIEPKIIVEKVLEDGENNSLIDYRFLCFDGVVKLIFIDIETASEDGTHNPYAKRNVYDKDFNYLDIKVGREQFDKSTITKPENFDKMIEYAQKLSEPFPFCRVDLYNLDGEIYFGEITFYPGGATQIVEPEEWEKKLGDWIDISKVK